MCEGELNNTGYSQKGCQYAGGAVLDCTDVFTTEQQVHTNSHVTLLKLLMLINVHFCLWSIFVKLIGLKLLCATHNNERARHYLVTRTFWLIKEIKKGFLLKI